MAMFGSYHDSFILTMWGGCYKSCYKAAIKQLKQRQKKVRFHAAFYNGEHEEMKEELIKTAKEAGYTLTMFKHKSYDDECFAINGEIGAKPPKKITLNYKWIGPGERPRYYQQPEYYESYWWSEGDPEL